MGISKEIENLQSELIQTIQSKDNIVVMEDYERILRVLEPVDNLLNNSLETYVLIMKLPKEFYESEMFFDKLANMKTSKSYLHTLIGVWESEDSLIINNNNYIDTMNYLKKSINEFQKLMMICWRNWVDSLKAKFHINKALLDTQKNLPHVEHIYSKYVKLVENFEGDLVKTPYSETQIKLLLGYSNQLIDLKNQMDFDIPEAVQKLFDALADRYNNNQAPLSLLTPEVISWLKDSGDIERLVIRSKF